MSQSIVDSAFKDPLRFKTLLSAIEREAEPDREYRFMEFCGGHTHTLFEYGIPDLLPRNIHLVHGPGCPVCILPIGRVDQAVFLAQQNDCVLCTYGDVMRVPGTNGVSLSKATSLGAQVQYVMSPNEIIGLAKASPEKRFIFFAVGFETTTPPTAMLLKQAKAENLNNILVHCNHVVSPPAVKAVLTDSNQTKNAPALDGLIAPGHVSLITGTDCFEEIARDYQLPIVITGFEPLDLLQSLLMLLRQCKHSQNCCENQYQRAVKPQGNLIAQQLIRDTFELREHFEWRGFGELPASGLMLAPQYRSFDAEAVFNLDIESGPENRACECPAVLRGVLSPPDCKLFGRACTPATPLGACMVSSEGACAAYYQYQRLSS